MKLKNKILLGAIGLGSIAMVVPTTLASCAQEEQTPQKKYEFFNFENCYKTTLTPTEDMNFDSMYLFHGQISETLSTQSLDYWKNNLNLVESGGQGSENNYYALDVPFKNLDFFKTLLNVGQLKEENRQESEAFSHIPDEYFQDIKDNSLLNSEVDYTSPDPVYKQHKWISYKDIQFNLDLESVKVELNFNRIATTNNNNEPIISTSVEIAMNMDQKHYWDNSKNNAPITIVLYSLAKQ